MLCQLLADLDDDELAAYLRKQQHKLKRARRARSLTMSRAERDGAPFDVERIQMLSEEVADIVRRTRAAEREMNRRS